VPDGHEHIFAFPIHEPTSTGRIRRIPIRKIFPPGAASKYPKDAFQALAVTGRRPTAELGHFTLG
jgi:hypothetical protein